MPIEQEKINPFAGRKYIRAVGRRKSAVAVVKLYPEGKGVFAINQKTLSGYFSHPQFTAVVYAPLEKTGLENRFDFQISAAGGGGRGQAEAVRLGLARALVAYDEAQKPILRKAGFLTVNSRVKERKKPGLKRARRAPQWQKR